MIIRDIIVRLDAEGHLLYEGLLSSQEIATIDEILQALKEEIPQIEADLEETYGKSILYKYNLGKILGELLTKYDISFTETRNFYCQCYRLSQYDQEIVEKLSWRQWQDILDRVGNREDERIFEWIRHKSEKIREDDWREFEKGLHLYLKNKDTSVFTDKELFAIYESILEMAKYWRISFGQFSKDFPNSAKIKSKARRSKKYQAECFRIKKDLRRDLDEEIFSQAFENAMK